MPISTDYRIDALLQGAESRWNNAASFGTPTIVPYAFMETLPAYYQRSDIEAFTAFTPADYASFSKLDAARRDLVRQEFAELAREIAGLAFVEVTDPAAAVIMIGAMAYDATARGDANGYDPRHADPAIAGDVWFNSTSGTFDITRTWTHTDGKTYLIGPDGFADMALHEINHALGLKHPGNYDQFGGAGTGSNSPPYLPAAEDDSSNTVMSYNGDLASPELRPYDILALNFLYGSQAPAGDQWLLATSGNSYIAGSSRNELILVPAAATVIDGGGGIDLARYAGNRNAFTVAKTPTGYSVAAAGESDQLRNVERLQFADLSVALDVNAHAGDVARILGAVFGPAAVQNRKFVGIGLHYRDEGMSIEDLAALAVTAAGKSAHGDVVDLLWNNVMGTPISAGARDYYVGLLDGGAGIGALTALAANTSQNALRIDLVGIEQTGLAYTEYLLA